MTLYIVAGIQQFWPTNATNPFANWGIKNCLIEFNVIDETNALEIRDFEPVDDELITIEPIKELRKRKSEQLHSNNRTD